MSGLISKIGVALVLAFVAVSASGCVVTVAPAANTTS